MIVIATNNGKQFLENLLKDIESCKFSDKISIIDTQSTDAESIEYLNELINNKNKFNLNITIYKTPYRGFDTGAYIYAINNINSEYYIFLQDSIRIKNNMFFQEIYNRLKPNTVIPLITFEGNRWDTDEQKNFAIKYFNTIEFDKGIFGPIFAARNEDLQKIDKSLLFYPTNKQQQQAMERIWCIIFNKYNFIISPLEGDYDDDKLFNNKYMYFSKHLPRRD